MAASWWTNLTMCQLAPLFGVSRSAADRSIDHLGRCSRSSHVLFAKDTMLIVDGTVVPATTVRIRNETAVGNTTTGRL